MTSNWRYTLVSGACYQAMGLCLRQAQQEWPFLDGFEFLGGPERGQSRLRMFTECQGKRTKRIQLNNDVYER